MPKLSYVYQKQEQEKSEITIIHMMKLKYIQGRMITLLHTYVEQWDIHVGNVISSGIKFCSYWPV